MDGPLATTDDLRRMVSGLDAMDPCADDGERIERVRLFQQVKAVCAAEQAVIAAEFDASQRAIQESAGEPADRQGRGVAAQLGLAMQTSPFAAARWLGFARIAQTELPATFAELRAGRTSEWRAMLVARETAVLSREHRTAVDADVAPHLHAWGDRRVEGETRVRAQRLDPAAAAARARKAESERRVTIRPAPDAMAYLTALAPVAQAVAAYACLTKHADSVTADGDERGRGQIMTDTLIERLTGQTSAAAVPVEIELLMTDQTLLNTGTAPGTGSGRGADEPAQLIGYGPIPADLARELAWRADTGAIRWLRRLYTSPDRTQLVQMDTKRRLFTSSQQRFLRLRDRTCRTPYCDAPIRHYDHLTSWSDGGTTTIDNGQGLCETCNHAKQAPGWQHAAQPNGSITTRTPTGHHNTSRAPSPPGHRRARQVGEIYLIDDRIDVEYHAA